MGKSSTQKKACLLIPLGFVVLCLLMVVASMISNHGLPQQSTAPDHLSELEKARLSEIIHLRKSLGDSVWPGWAQADIPLIVYNEKYAILVGYPNPPEGWMKVPDLDPCGGVWEEISNDTFEGRPYYRTPITDLQKTPEAFTVLVGDRWVATFPTREYAEVSFYQDFRKNLSPFVSRLIPLRLPWILLMGKSERYVASLEHESFHAFEGALAAYRLDAAESMYSVEIDYPFDAMEALWKLEMDVLVQAVQAITNDESINLAREFLRLRASRRAELTPEQVNLERLREWEEGLAKYAELEITHQAEANLGYQPVAAISQDGDFHSYQGEQKFWSEQLKEARNTQGRSGDTRFYYSGNALAILLDRLSSGWKPRALPGGRILEDILSEVVR